jgi:hypothetical protein
MRALNLVGGKAHTPQPVYITRPGFRPTQWKLENEPTKADYSDFILNHQGIVQLIDVTYTNDFNQARVNASKPSFAANAAEKDKLKEATKRYTFPPGAAIGFAIELHGALGANAQKLLTDIHLWTKANDPYKFNSKGLSYAYTTISTQILRTNASIADNCRYATRRTAPPSSTAASTTPTTPTTPTTTTSTAT